MRPASGAAPAPAALGRRHTLDALGRRHTLDAPGRRRALDALCVAGGLLALPHRLVTAATPRSTAAPAIPTIGQRLPAREFIDPEQRRHGPERWHGKALVLNVWATWCAPCREEMPSLARLRARLAGRPVEIVALNIGESENRLDQFGDSVRERPPIVRDAQGGLMKAWRIGLLPTTYLVDAAGKLVKIEPGARDWSTDAVLAELEPLIPR